MDPLLGYYEKTWIVGLSGRRASFKPESWNQTDRVETTTPSLDVRYNTSEFGWDVRYNTSEFVWDVRYNTSKFGWDVRTRLIIL